jgi:hydroxymethylglutaryl-CoA reductase (NADPH)
MVEYPIVPGRGLVNKESVDMRNGYLDSMGLERSALSSTTLQPEQIQCNIESFIGSVEVPVGLVGPLLYNDGDTAEMVYTAAGTLEGALIASMNRGVKAISKSGGFTAAVIHQKMIRSPLFIFSSLKESIVFRSWIEKQFAHIKYITEQYSNHAKLQSIQSSVTGRSVHLKFVYTTCDASGQNMTTTCTWHGILWIRKKFAEECGIEPVHFVIEGNGASDKKVSHFSMLHGRGIHVVAECELEEQVIERVLRTNSADLVRCLNQSRVQSQLDGMMGYNINVANAIAAIFVATGQDLASIHESSIGILNIEQSEKGLYCSLNLPSLVIGTLGGGTHLPAQQEALKLTNCQGKGKIERFAKLIAGFALSLELSTFAAIVSGQFAKAHEKLGRNKPVCWLTKSDINKEFIAGCLNDHIKPHELLSVKLTDNNLIENGIIINLTSRLNNKVTGFVSLEIEAGDKERAEQQQWVLKSKPLDIEVVKGLHLMASSIDTQLADLIYEHWERLEYKSCHIKEIQAYQLLHNQGKECMPRFFGSKINDKREIYLLLLERIDYNDVVNINSENEPERWSGSQIMSVIQTINGVHDQFSDCTLREECDKIQLFEPWHASELYEKLAQIISTEYADCGFDDLSRKLLSYLADLEQEHRRVNIKKTIIHNDFNPRNICIRKNDAVCIYDWELAALNFPHRDIVEFLSFALPENFEADDFELYIRYHFSIQKVQTGWEEWKIGYVYALKEYLVTRVSFYMVGRVLMEYEFAIRIFLNAFRMIDILETL